MKLLALESSCERASVALFVDGEVHMRRLEGHANHSEHVLAAVRGLLAEAESSVRALDAVAFGAGPGAFTGLRLACGVAQGLALGAGLGVIPVCTLAALALQAPDGDTLAMTDARMGELYHARYRVADGAVLELTPPACCLPGELVCPEEGAWFGIGSAFAAHGAELAAVRAALSGCDPDAVPTAAAVAKLAAGQAAAGIVPPEWAVPLYVRNKVALTTAERLARGNKA
ncbi:MAG: tRNA (adenosine(37)-N6)-threonylcarbamoyltransferase complex dimerization subunit type 1 TsaB [Azoarcus sp.]|jgi:tRNA threonylcarbamoyladenosine biosynthesis protein TsaB|nr:tRNA (adenosine(37)-N6)-threonylcarbamoyltransferase complex dimerization subunit type 1 TsaB [Azoarcus sp.]